jgi:transcription termination/antitermination protein NusG
MHIDVAYDSDASKRDSSISVDQALSWYAVRTLSRHEKKVALQLERKAIEAFLPLVPQLRSWSDRDKLVTFPLFPGYVFVHIVPSFRLNVLRNPGVASFVCMNGEPAPVPLDQIENVRKLLATKQHLSAYPYLQSGARVRIRGGSLDGIEGTFVSQGNGQMLVVSIDAIGKSVAISLHGYRCEPV